MREAFEQAPVPLCACSGPEHRVVAVNAAYRAAAVRQELVGSTVDELYPEARFQEILAVFDRVYATGVAESKKAWRMQLTTDEGLQEFFFDFTVTPWFDTGRESAGFICSIDEVSEQVRERREAEERAAEAEARYARARSTLAALQQALLPADLPLLPGVDLDARYVLAEVDTAAGGDWYDAVVLSEGRVALVAGDVVGHGVKASAVMGQLRAVVQERLRAGCGPAEAMNALDRHARHVPGAEAATCCIAVLVPATGALTYAGAGHPAPLIIDADGTAEYLPATGQGPLATGATYTDHTGRLPPGATLLHYSDGIVERPGTTPESGRKDLARIASLAAQNLLMPRDSPTSTSRRVVEQTLEVLLRESGHSDDVTVLAAHRTAVPRELEVVLPADPSGARQVQAELGQWLLGLNCTEDDESQLQHAVVELVTNAAEHAYVHVTGVAGLTGPGREESAGGQARDVTVRGYLDTDGSVVIEVADRGRWQDVPHQDPFRGRGLAMARTFTDSLTVDRAESGTTVRLRKRLSHPVTLTASRPAAARPADLTVTEDLDVPGLLTVTGRLDAVSAERFTGDLTTHTRGGTRPLTVDLSGVTHLASAGVRVLHRTHDLLVRNDRTLTLYAPPGSVADNVLDLAGLPHTTRPPHRTG
ncbi:SpoIIE family protein phosphatase [Streptomyces populi]|uniref:SpoIIE family protein phosphatase n=1 Tax=Streptomyces populi TaxID=2058924 RepID=UPI0013A6B5BB|nr:SpoIIE family protein phosphatase [Streptomyces populi]